MSDLRSDKTSIRDFLSSVPTYSALSDRALEAIIRSGRVKRIPRGYLLFNQSELADAVYVVHSGCIALTLAMAREDSYVLSIPRDEFMRILSAEPEFMLEILKTTALRLRVSSERESALAFLNASTRLAQVLLMLDKEGGSAGIIRTTQDEIGSRVGMTRQTVAKILGGWRRSGIIRTGRRKIELMKPDAIQSEAVGET
jgi:CRP-like cAMP-binding protein